MAKGKTACIVCKKEGIKGAQIRDDAILQAIRNIKTRLGILRGFTLVVCDEDMEEYKKKREKFEKMAVIHTTVAAIIVIVFIFGPLLLGAPFNPLGIFFSLIIGLLFAAFSLLSYVPSLEDGAQGTVPTPSQIASRLMPKAFSGAGAGKKAPAKESKKPAKSSPKKAYMRKKRRG